MTRREPSTKAQRAMLARLRECGLLLAGPDHPVLRRLERRRWARAMMLHDSRTGKPTMARAWQITAAGTAASLGLERTPRRASSRLVDHQIDIEDAIATTSSGGRPEAAPLTVSDHAGVRAPAGATAAAMGRADARGPKTLAPETPTP